MFSALLFPLVLVVQIPPDIAARDKANAEAVVSQVGEKANVKVNVEAVAREVLEKLEKDALQYPADFTTGQKVIVYSTGPRSVNFEFASASDLTEYMMRMAEYLSAGMSGNAKAQQEALQQSHTSMQSLQSRHLAGTVPSGTLQEVISSRWISFPRRLGVMGPIPGRYIYELSSLEQKSPAKGKVGWMDENDLVLAPPRLLSASVTPMDRTMRLGLYFSLHQPYKPADDAGANDSADSARAPSGRRTAGTSGTSEPSGTDSTHFGKSAKSMLPRADSERDSSPDFSVAILDHNEGLVGEYYKVYVQVRNSSSTTLRFLQMTVLYKSSSDRLLHTEFTFAEPTHVGPGETATFSLSTHENVDQIHHYDLKFESNDRNVKFTLPSR